MQSRFLRWTPLVLSAAYLLPLGVRPLLAPDEVRYGEISREMIASGEWIVPHFLGLRYFEKPVLGYWLNSLSELLFGYTNFAVRLPSALGALFTAAIVGWFTARSSGEKNYGYAAASIYLSFLIVFVLGTTSVLDNLLALWTSTAMVMFHEATVARSTRERLSALTLFGICCGLGFLTKGGVALAVPVVAIVPFMLWNGRWLDLVRWGCIAIVPAVLVALPWALAIASREGDFWRFFFWEEHIRRFAGADAQHPQPLWFFLPVAIAGALPWTFALPTASRVLRAQCTALPRMQLVRYLLLWLVMPFVLFSIARGKLVTYILPCFAPAAVLLALGLMADATLTAASRSRRIAVVSLALLPLMLALPFGHLMNGKWGRTPGSFIEAQARLLGPDTIVLSDDVSLAGALGWYLSRSDIILYDTSGELEYGLGYPEGASRRVAKNDFASWLERERAGDDVALFRSGAPSHAVPPADVVVTENRYSLYLYRRRD